MTIEMGVLLSLIVAVCGVAFKLGALSQTVTQHSAALEKLANAGGGLDKIVAQLASDMRIVMSRVDDIRVELQKGRVHVFDPRENR